MNLHTLTKISAAIGIGLCSFIGGYKFPKKSIAQHENALTVNGAPESPSTFSFKAYNDIKDFGKFVVCMDRKNRVPKWVLEHLTPDCLYEYQPGAPLNNRKSTPRPPFFEDLTEPAEFRATLEDFAGSGFDRGHLAAAANYQKDERTNQQTFVLSNIAPQVGVGFNRHIWNTLEKFVRIGARNCEHTFVCTGPLYLPEVDPSDPKKRFIKYQVIGKNDVAVPTHFFKVVVFCQPIKSNLTKKLAAMRNESETTADNAASSLAIPKHASSGDWSSIDLTKYQLTVHSFVIPNRNLMLNSTGATNQQQQQQQKPHSRYEDLHQYQVPLETVERRAGFFILSQFLSLNRNEIKLAPLPARSSPSTRELSIK